METNEIKDKAQEWQGEAQEATQHLQSEAESKMSGLKDTARQWQRRASESSRKAAQATDNYVHENAWTCSSLSMCLHPTTRTLVLTSARIAIITDRFL